MPRYTKWLLIAAMICGTVLIAKAQTATPTPEPKVLVSQSFLDDATKAFQLVVALRDELQKEKDSKAAGDVTKATLQAEIVALNDLIAIKDRKEAVYEQLLVLRDKAFAAYDVIIKIQADMIDRQWKQLNKSKSGFDKFLSALKEIASVAVGIIIGRGGIR